jgi:dephospho-CoA kinase
VKLPLQVGVTGGIGSGKSLICRIFGILGVPVYDADSHAKELMTTDGILISQIKKEFGELSFLNDGTLNRAFLSKEVFSDASKLEKLNSLVHPRVALNYDAWVRQHCGVSYVVKEAALLIEAKSYLNLDKLIVVSAPENIRVKRVLERDKHRTEKQVYEVIKNQVAEEEKRKLADHIIVNDETELVITQVLGLHQLFNSKKALSD